MRDMDEHTNKVKCPNCGQEIDVSDLLYHQLDDELSEKYKQALAEEKRKFDSQFASLQQEKQELEKEKREIGERIGDGVKEGVKAEVRRLEKKLRQQAEEEKSEQFNKAKSEIERLKREKSELRDAIEAESLKRLNATLEKERAKIQKAEEEKSQLKVSEREQIIESLRQQLKEAQRKAEQGSMQLQGEVQELGIEAWLRDNFPLDTIEEIKKGARGADCLQIIHTRTRQNCGSIYYESKRTKAFQASWIDKFKSDIRDKGADIGVLVTEVMPADMERMGFRDGVWVCSFDEFKGLCTVLRESVIQLSSAIATQENKGDKMGMLYDFLTGNEFRLQIEAIVEGFTQMQADLESEKRSLQGIWKKREKQIDKVLHNTNFMYSSIKGIAGNAIQSVPLLELPPGDEETDTD
jgi:hypothetical protein